MNLIVKLLDLFYIQLFPDNRLQRKDLHVNARVLKVNTKQFRLILCYYIDVFIFRIGRERLNYGLLRIFKKSSKIVNYGYNWDSCLEFCMVVTQL